MELRVGQFVRTKKGIFQIRNKDVFIEDKKQYIGVNGRYTCIDIETIEKASHNIIDLIEVGDYVNGYMVEYVYNPTGNEVLWFNLSCNPLELWENKDIKTIVTKEQMEAMQYKVEE